MRLTNKLTLKELCGPIKNHFLKLVNKETGEIPAGVRIPLARIAGKATSFFIKETDLGPSVGLKGSFTGMSLMPGDNYQKPVKSGQCYLPGSAGDMVAAAFADGDSKNNAVEFAFDIVGVSDPLSNVLYTFAIESLQEPQGDDSVSRLLASLPPPPAPAGAETTPASGATPASGGASAETTPVGGAAPAEPQGAEVKKSEPVAGPETNVAKDSGKQDAKPDPKKGTAQSGANKRR